MEITFEKLSNTDLGYMYTICFGMLVPSVMGSVFVLLTLISAILEFFKIIHTTSDGTLGITFIITTIFAAWLTIKMSRIFYYKEKIYKEAISGGFRCKE